MDNLLSDDGQIDAQQLLALYSVKFLVTAIQNSNTFFGRYCGVEDSAIAALTVAPYYMWVAERTICATLGVSEVEKIEYAFTKAIKLFGQKEDTANAIVKEYLETFALDHAKSQITNVSFRESIIFLMISSINGRMVSSKLDEEINTTIIEHVDSCYNNVVLNSDELGKHISNAQHLMLLVNDTKYPVIAFRIFLHIPDKDIFDQFFGWAVRDEDPDSWTESDYSDSYQEFKHSAHYEEWKAHHDPTSDAYTILGLEDGFSDQELKFNIEKC